MADGFFLLLVFLDSFLIFLPGEGLVALTLLFVPDKKWEWFTACCVGHILGFALFSILSQTTIQPALVEMIIQYDYSHNFQKIMHHAAQYGYLDISIGAFTFVPAIICLIGGIAVGLNVWMVFLVVSLVKIVRIYFIFVLVKSVWKSAIYVKDKVEEYRKDHSA